MSTKNKTFRYIFYRKKPKPLPINEGGKEEEVSPSVRKPKSAKKPKRKKDPFYMSWGWRKLRLEALLVGESRCSICGKNISDVTEDGMTKIKLSVDHIKPRITHPELELEITNLRILCVQCHEAITGVKK